MNEAVLPLTPTKRLGKELEERCIVGGPQRLGVAESRFKATRPQFEAKRQKISLALDESVLQ